MNDIVRNMLLNEYQNLLSKLSNEYQNLLNRLDSAENWAIEHKFNWDYVKVHKPKIWYERDNIIKQMEFIRELLSLHG